MAELMAVFEQLLIPDREQCSPQRRKHRQLIVRPLDRRERGAQRFDFAAIVKRPAADEQMRDAARFERPHVRPRHVVSEADEAAEQQADVPGLDRDEAFRSPGLKPMARPSAVKSARCDRCDAAFGHFPAALVDQPIDVRADGIGKRLLN